MFEQDHPGAGEVTLELGDVPDGGAAEGIDRLVGVTNHAQLTGWHEVIAADVTGLASPDQLPDQHVLGVVGVLVLVDEHVPEPPAVLGRHVGKRLQQVHGDHDQIVEVHGTGRHEPPLILPVRLRQRLLPVPGGPRGDGLVVEQLVLQRGNPADHRLRRVVLGIEV